MKQTLVSSARARLPYVVGVEFGEDDVRAGVVNDSGRVLSWLTEVIQIDRGPEAGSGQLASLALRAIAAAGLKPKDAAHVGLALPGTIDAAAGALACSAVLPGWRGFPLADRVGGQCGLPATLVNDALAAAYAERWVGAGRNFESIVVLTLGKRIGGGILIGDLAIDGRSGRGSQCGHILVDATDAARRCNCGQRGCLEAYVGQTALVELTREALAAGRASSLSVRLAAGAPLTAALVADAAESGDSLATQLVLDSARMLAVGVVSIMHTIDPGAVLFGGNMIFGGAGSELGRRFLAQVREEVQRLAFAILARNTLIDFAAFGEQAGVIGAAAAARQEGERIAKPRPPLEQA